MSSTSVLPIPHPSSRVQKKLESDLNWTGKSKCVYCGKTVSADFAFDHIIPKSKGGIDDDSNLLLSCPRCNSSKGAKTLSDFRHSRGKPFNFETLEKQHD